MNICKRKTISANQYNAICDKIIEEGLPVHETLMKLLAEAQNYTVKGVNRSKIQPKRCKTVKTYPKGGKK